MYQTIDEINKGALFWRSVVRAWPAPFCPDDVDSFGLSFAGDVMLTVCWNSEQGDERRRLVRLVQGDDEELLSVFLTDQWEYVRGESLGMLVDEVAAVSSLRLFAAEPVGPWYVPESEVEDEGTNV